MRKIIRLSIFIIIIAFIFLVYRSCSNSPESVYRRMLKKYKSGDGNISLMAEKFLQAYSEKSLGYNGIFYNKNIVLSVTEEHIEMVYPEEEIIDGDRSLAANLSFADMNDECIVIGNSSGFCVFDSGGDLKTLFKAEKDTRVDALAVRGENVIYLSSGKLYELSCSSKEVKQLDSGVYHSPYRKFFRSTLHVADKYIVMVSGIAGSYYINVFDSSSGNVMMKHIIASASELNVNSDSLSYIRGGTGTWSVTRYEIPQKKRTELKKLGKINNAYLGDEGFITLGAKENIIESYDGRRGLLPAMWNVMGICRDAVLIEYGSVVYIFRFRELLDRVIVMNSDMGESVP